METNPEDDAPTGMPEGAPEEEPLGPPETRPDDEVTERGAEGMPGIPTDGEPPAAS